MRYSLILACLALSACATPAVDTAAPNFSETRYAADLDECRGGTALTAVVRGLGKATVGSFVGAAEGAYLGAINGDSKEGVIIGAAVGSVVGFAVGTYTPIEQQDAEIGQCLSGKGYSLRL
jgi:hypothetical protein